MYLTTRRRPGPARWLAPILVGCVAGTALQLMQPALWHWFAYAVALLAGAGLAWQLLASGLTGARYRTAMALAVALVMFAQVGLRAAAFQSGALAPELQGRDLQLTAVVAAMPQASAAGLRLQLEVELASADGVAVRLPPRILVSWYGARPGTDAGAGDLTDPIPEIHAGERWHMTVRLKQPHGNSNPHGFDYELWLWEHDLQATGYVRTGAGQAVPRHLGQTWRHPVELARQSVRRRIDTHLPQSPAAGWISALVTGDQNAIDRADWDVFRATGVAHLMSISGLHVTMFAWMAGLLGAALWRRSPRLCLRLAAPHAALIGAVTLATAYALFSGWGVPAQRTIWMLATVCLLRLSGRSWPWPVVLLLAGAVVLAIDPWALLQAGFWLSFVAVGVLFASDAREEDGAPRSIAVRLRAMLREQWIMTLALTPLVLLLFGQVSLVGFVANLLAIPWVTLLVTPLAMAGALIAPAWDLAAWAIAVLAWYLQLLAQLPFATVSVAMAPWWLGAAAVAGAVLLVMPLPMSLRVGGAALMLPVLLWQSPRPAPGQFELLAADIGQGNAVLVRTENHALLYDAGPRFGRDSDAGHRVLLPLLRALGVELDLLVLSHRDSDHVGGAQSVLAMQGRAGLLSSIEPEHPLWAVRPGRRCEAGQSWRWDGVDFVVLHPRAQDYLVQTKSNALSCVLRINAVDIGGSVGASALLTGDIESAQEQRLLADGANLQADLLLVPHHGSKTSSSAPWLDKVQPRMAWVQSGYRNRFGHPAPVVAARYAERGIPLMASPECGAMRWQSWAPQTSQCERSENIRYWHHVATPISRF